jgi:hypothetical protein
VEFKDSEGMLKHVVHFYKTLFGKEQRENIRLDENFWGEEDMISREENDLLEAPFTEEEIKKAIDGSYAGGPPSHDGFSFFFYQKF